MNEGWRKMSMGQKVQNGNRNCVIGSHQVILKQEHDLTRFTFFFFFKAHSDYDLKTRVEVCVCEECWRIPGGYLG